MGSNPVHSYINNLKNWKKTKTNEKNIKPNGKKLKQKKKKLKIWNNKLKGIRNNYIFPIGGSYFYRYNLN